MTVVVKKYVFEAMGILLNSVQDSLVKSADADKEMTVWKLTKL